MLQLNTNSDFNYKTSSTEASAFREGLWDFFFAGKIALIVAFPSQPLFWKEVKTSSARGMCLQSCLQAWQEQKRREIKANPVIQPNWMRWKQSRQQLQETGKSNRLILIQMFGSWTGLSRGKKGWKLGLGIELLGCSADPGGWGNMEKWWLWGWWRDEGGKG